MHELHMYILPLKICMGVICTSPSSRVTTYTVSGIPNQIISQVVFAMPLYVSVNMCLVVTCRKRADLLALVCGV